MAENVKEKITYEIKQFCDACDSIMIDYIRVVNTNGLNQEESIKSNLDKKVFKDKNNSKWICEDCYNKIPEFARQSYLEIKSVKGK